MNILITSGGTSEKIDDVRFITNFSTGSLGKRIAETFASSEKVDKVFLLHGRNAKLPESEKIEKIPCGGVQEVIETIRRVVAENKIDAIVHSMAVSDYGVDAAFSSRALSEYLAKQFSGANMGESLADEEATADLIENMITNFEGYSANGKIRSDVEHLMINLGRTPKIISVFKEFTPRPVIVGFKLLSGVSKAELIDVAHALLLKNECDYVLANDLTSISGENHTGYLIDKDRSEKVFKTKQEIANGIVETVCTLCEERAKN
ncbi:MAG: phosphopantothenate--cysteine ligase [Clostridia bacterium]|nr:phosphopantothenate--cysteine ligase [Clostridia bacterium]